LSQHGLFNRTTGDLIVRETEKEIFNKLGLKYIPPEDRNTKKITATMKAFALRSSPDRSYVGRLLGRVENPSVYPKSVQKFLPYSGEFILPTIVSTARHLDDFLGRK